MHPRKPDEPSVENGDTIVAVATAPGRGGVGIVRLSGPDACAISQSLCGKPLPPRTATLAYFRDEQGQTVDQGVALYFPAPGSFTGEEVVELQGHGGPIILDHLLETCVKAGARLARPGEFSERAFLNDKMDLAQAEAVADLIAASTRGSARSALRSLQGEFSRRVDRLQLALTQFRVQVEAALDFPDEDIDLIAEGALDKDFDDLSTGLDVLLKETQRGALLRNGAVVVLAGQPNAGKSSLLNCLAGDDLAIVTDIAGTTRDSLSHTVKIGDLAVELVDTAGLRDSDDPVEQEGVRRARKRIEHADALLLVVDSHAGFDNKDQSLLDEYSELPKLLVLNKSDLSTATEPSVDCMLCHVSAKNSAGIQELEEKLSGLLGLEINTEGTFSARQRHVDSLWKTRSHLIEAKRWLQAGREGAVCGEFLAEELRLAQECLSGITGEFAADDLLGEIFGSFCIGK
ncbi:MAG: tRNA uridine-5-carboxymethylaminomethyl(34) synthesis GTPase MnmE [Granulosicoccaceae bacterium]